MQILMKESGAVRLKARNSDGSGVVERLECRATDETLVRVGRECIVLEFDAKEETISKSDLEARATYAGATYSCRGPKISEGERKTLVEKVNELRVVEDPTPQQERVLTAARKLLAHGLKGCGASRTLEFLSIPYDGEDYAIRCAKCGGETYACNPKGNEPWRRKAEAAEED